MTLHELLSPATELTATSQLSEIQNYMEAECMTCNENFGKLKEEYQGYKALYDAVDGHYSVLEKENIKIRKVLATTAAMPPDQVEEARAEIREIANVLRDLNTHLSMVVRPDEPLCHWLMTKDLPECNVPSDSQLGDETYARSWMRLIKTTMNTLFERVERVERNLGMLAVDKEN